MAAIELNTDGPVAYRSAAPAREPTGTPVVLVHGFPESSLMYEPLMSALADAGRPCFAPDLYSLGDSTEFGSATFEHSRERFDAWFDELNIDGKVVVVVHDFGGFIGLSWACDHPDRVATLVISDTGFFSDGKWHDMAQGLRSDQGETIIDSVDRDVFAMMLNGEKQVFSDAEVDAYWAPFERGDGGRATLEFYRSMDFEKLEKYDGKLGELGVPTLIIWGADDPFSPIPTAHRFESEIPGSKLIMLEDTGHFVWDERTEETTSAVVDFLAAN
jgi:haloalkane dehalogenase